ncbi:hypothetical protein BP422_26940 [Brevibacillus formosus]|uniref:Uncharacterized protein n=1 Tax=Brevibacillus formosus TaxID=54913 RepID=A0A220MNZ2_9BACL|nr:hypothetical protein [Brevibacillus formosus]ASJ56837.1 hypothetical protein BP422_26940 [Brevibacillus formosus]
MRYLLATILTPVLIENIGEYGIMYDDLNDYSIWYEKQCLTENTTLKQAREFCKARIRRNGKIVFVLNTYFLNIRGQTFSKYVDEDRWHMRYHFPWIGFYPILQDVKEGTPLFDNLIDDFIEAEKMRRIRNVFKPYLCLKDRERYNRI